MDTEFLALPYLWHWPLLAFAVLWGSGQAPDLKYRLALAALALGLAELSFRMIEQPVRRGKFLSQMKSIYVIPLFVILSLLVVLITSAISRYESSFILPKWEALAKLVNERTSLPAKCGELNDNFTSCEIKAANQFNNNFIAVWGDSHAYAVFSLFEELAKIKSMDAQLYSAVALPSLLSTEGYFRGTIGTLVDEYHKKILINLQNKKNIYKKVSVVLASRWVHYASGHWPISLIDGPGYLDTARTKTGSLQIFKKSLLKTIMALRNIGVDRIMIILPYPEFKFDVLRCRQRSPELCQTLRVDMDEYRKDVTLIITNVAKDFTNVQTLDPVEVLCDDRICSEILFYQNNEIPVVFDDDHPSASAMRLIFEKKQPVFDWLIDYK